MATVADAIGLKENEYRDLMNANATWPFPAQEDALVIAHKALRADLVDAAAAVDAIIARENDGKPRAEKVWELVNFRNWFHVFEHNLTHHLDVHEKFFFKLLRTKVQDSQFLVPGTDTNAVLAALHKVAAELSALSTQKPWHCAALKSALLRLTEVATAYFDATEGVPLALLRKQFTREEAKWALEKHVVEDGSPQDAGWLLARAFHNDQDRDDWLHRVPIVSVTRRKEVDIPAAHKYLKQKQTLIADVISGELHY